MNRWIYYKAILMVVKQLKAKAENADYVLSIENQYSRIVPNEGNKLAQKALKDVFMLKESSEWRGLGEDPYVWYSTNTRLC